MTMRFFNLYDNSYSRRKEPTQLQLFNAQTSRTNMILQEQQRVFNRTKSVVDSLIQSYKDAKSEALQYNIVKTMRDYYTLLPPGLRIAVDPYIAQGPTSPIEQKERDWKRYNKPPPKPILDEAPGSEVSNINSQVDYLFKMADYNRAHKAFLYGASAVEPRVKMLGLPDGNVAIRSDKGLITILSKQDLELKQLSEKYDIPVKDIILNQGVFDTGKTSLVIMNGKQYKYHETYAPFEEDQTKRRGLRLVDVQTAPKSSYDREMPKKLTSFMMEWKNPDTKNGTVKYLKDLAKDNPKVAEQNLREIFPRYSFRIVKRKTVEATPGFGWLPDFTPFVSADYEYALIAIFGTPIGLSDATGKKYKFYYDQPNDIVSNKWGKILGNLDAVREQLSQTTIGE